MINTLERIVFKIKMLLDISSNDLHNPFCSRDKINNVLQCSGCCNRYYRYYRSVGVIVRCLVLKQPDCMSLIVQASRSIFARDGPALLKAVTTWQRGHYI